MLSALKRLVTRPTPKQEPIGGTLVNAYATVRDLPPLPFAHAFHNGRGLDDPELATHLHGFKGYVRGATGGRMTADVFHLLGHISRVRRQASFTVPDASLDALAHWAAQANAILFLPDGSVRDPQGRVLVSRGVPPVDPEASLPYPAEAWARKERSQAQLAARGLRTLDSLPPVVSESEVLVRSPGDVLGRAGALMVAAVRAESLHIGEPMSADELRAASPWAFAHLSPREQAFLGQDAPDPTTIVQFAWRYEGVHVLEWALGLIDELPFPSTHCDAGAVSATLRTRPAHAPRLRATPELLDALDLTLRLHWVTRQAQVDGRLPVDGVDAGVVHERHYALNWLLQVQSADWDDVDTPT